MAAGNVVLGDKLGKGGFGTVYKGQLNGKEVAVKVVDIGGIPGDMLNEAAKEINIMKNLSHQNVVQFYGSSVVRSRSGLELRIFMEFCQDGDLHRAILQRKASGTFFPEAQIFRWFQDTTRGVQYLHSKNIVHRDIKPLNILLHNGCVKMADFGLSKLHETLSDYYTYAYGTTVYAPPELTFKKKCGRSGDMWSLGVTFFEVATLSRPFNSVADIVNYGSGDFHLRPTPKEYCDVTRKLIQLMLTFDPDRRPNALQVLQIIDKARSSIKSDSFSNATKCVGIVMAMCLLCFILMHSLMN